MGYPQFSGLNAVGMIKQYKKWPSLRHRNWRKISMRIVACAGVKKERPVSSPISCAHFSLSGVCQETCPSFIDHLLVSD